MNLLVQLDPLNSPHPVPWNWILAAHGAALAAKRFVPQSYRSAALRSPDGDCLAYSRIHLELCPQLYACTVTSLLLIENQSQGTLQAIQATSSLAQEPEAAEAGMIAILMPVAWNQAGNRLLARQFEGRFCSSMATDYALVWDAATGNAQAMTPLGQEQAVLLGWSAQQPEAVLFEAGGLGEDPMPRWRLDGAGLAEPAPEDSPLAFGEAIADALTGPQTSLC